MERNDLDVVAEVLRDRQLLPCHSPKGKTGGKGSTNYDVEAFDVLVIVGAQSFDDVSQRATVVLAHFL